MGTLTKVEPLRRLTLKVLSLLLIATFCAGCYNVEALRKKNFTASHATKNPTSFLPYFIGLKGQSTGPRSLPKSYPIMLLKKGIGYSLFQLQNGSIGEIPNEDIRLAQSKEVFVDLLPEEDRQKSLWDYSKENLPDSTAAKSSSHSLSLDPENDQSPILQSSLSPIEPELPLWEEDPQ